LVIAHAELIAGLQGIQNGEEVQREQARREKLRQKLEEARWEIRSRRIPIPPAPAYARAGNDPASLPEGIDLESGRLEIRFSTPVELLQKMMALARVISEDWDGYVDRTRG
jgi:hypothetical protein